MPHHVYTGRAKSRTARLPRRQSGTLCLRKRVKRDALLTVILALIEFPCRDWQSVKWPRSVYIAAQAVIGTALGAGFSLATLLTLPKHFSIQAFAVVFILFDQPSSTTGS